AGGRGGPRRRGPRRVHHADRARLVRSDPAIPQRDLLLDPAAMRAPLQEALGAPLDGCAVERVKYRVGESLRVLYRIELDGSSQLVSLRTFEEERARREAMHAL